MFVTPMDPSHGTNTARMLDSQGKMLGFIYTAEGFFRLEDPKLGNASRKSKRAAELASGTS